MKFFAIIGMVSTLLMSSVGVSDGMSVASPCTHEYKQSGEIWRPVSGYDHTYNTADGVASCSVTVYYVYDEEWCISCGALVSSEYVKTKHDHSVAAHNND